MEPINDVLKRMADLVRERPAATVRELADHLGYTQERSVYYWLNKADFQGIRQFRDAVLRGEFAERRAPQPAPAGNAVPLYRLSQMPLPPDDRPPASRQVVVDLATTPGFFAFEAEGTEYAPLIEPLDQLVVDPEAELRDGDLALVMVRGYGPAVRRIFGQRPTWLVHPSRGRPFEAQNDPVILGRIVRLLRVL
ncbi:LexA family transcriptional regulator [Limnochorda pilosa]|nr:hypothetical protein [Limnochorda pilosa]